MNRNGKCIPICLKWMPWILYGVSFPCFSRDETVLELTILPIYCYVLQKKPLLGWIRVPESSIYWVTGSFRCTSGDTTHNSFRMRILPTFLWGWPIVYTFIVYTFYIPSFLHLFLYTYDLYTLCFIIIFVHLRLSL